MAMPAKPLELHTLHGTRSKAKPKEASAYRGGRPAPDARGNAEVMMPPLPPGTPAKAFAVTVEPAGGMPQPTGPKVLIGAVS